MKKIILCASLVGITCFTTAAFAGEPYIKAYIGYNALEDSDLTLTSDSVQYSGDLSYDGNIFIAAAVGYDFGCYRFDGEVGYSQNDTDSLSITVDNTTFSMPVAEGDITSASVMANGYYDFDTRTVATPYLGVGLGFARLDIDTGYESDDDLVFAYQINLGVNIELTKSAALDLGYRYFATEDPSYELGGTGYELEYSSHLALAGIKVAF